MSDAGYVIAGWALTGGVVLGYWVLLIRRTRRAEATAASSEEIRA